MAACSRCGTALIATARFCAACGSPVALNTTPRPATQPMSASNQVAAQPAPGPSPGAAAPDPFARTVMGDPGAATGASEPRMPTAPLAQVAIAPARPNPVSPMASSVMNTPGDPRKPASATPWNVPASVANPYAPTRPPPPVAPAQAPVQAPMPAPVPVPMGAFGPGTMVLVYWSDGNRYPGTVLQSANGQVLVAFPNGQQQWIDMKFVSAGT